ncbi:MAG: hypothetical protein AAFY88_19615, partial [Acidobacteriota bacterium]
SGAAGARFGFLPSLHAVDRSSRGAEYFPLSICLLLLFTGERVWLYVAAILVLAVGDAFAALIGGRYGVIHYEVQGGRKTLEGSLVFFIIAFLAILLPTLLMTDLPRAVCVLAAAPVAILVTFFEAISLRGSDNLFVPLGTAVILDGLTRQPLAEIVYQNLSLAGICIGLVALAWRLPYFNPGSTMALILFTYGTWAVGGWEWALPAFFGTAVYLASWAAVEPMKKAPPIQVQTTLRALATPFVFVALVGGTGERELLTTPYLAASAAVLAVAAADPLHRLGALKGRRRDAVALGAGAAALVIAPVRIASPGLVQASALLGIPALLIPMCWVVLRHECRRHGAPLAEWSAPRFLLSWAVAVPFLW